MTSTTPPFLMWPMVGIWLLVVLVRHLMLPRTLSNRRINLVLFFEAMTAVLRAPEVQDLIAPHVDDIGIVRPIGHVFAMLAAAALVGMVRSWSGREERAHTQMASYGTVLVLGVLMLILSAPSRAHHMTIEEFGTWRAVAYQLCYSLPVALMFGGAAVMFVKDWKSLRRTGLRVIGVILIALAVVSVIDNLFRLFYALLAATHASDALEYLRSSSNDALFLPTVTVLALVTLIPVVTAVRGRFNPDADSVAVDKLEPLWALVTAAAPEVVVDRRLHKSATPARRRLYRMAIEIRDGELILDPYTPELDPAAVEDALSYCNISALDRDAVLTNVKLIRAAAARRADSTPRSVEGTNRVQNNVVAGLDDELSLLGRLADNWPDAVIVESQYQLRCLTDVRT
ncbi:MAG: hypothetical protein GX610_23105 [Rhodococcus sp.]|nr:hypothetical protein [Rhodococcus sp. (in: high G+C Gram-positive bacteria)]